MPARRDTRTGRWYFRKAIRFSDGRRERLFGVPGSGEFVGFGNTKVGAEAAERFAIQRAVAGGTGANTPAQKEEELNDKVPLFAEWFTGRFWKEWVVGRKNKPTEVRSKNIIFKKHLKPRFGEMPLDRITTSEVAQFRADLVAKKLSDKRINNILAVLSKPLKYAVDCEVIPKAPRIGMFKVERPEIVAWDFDQYARLLAAAKAEGEDWFAAVCLCGEAGLRVGEMKALRWREDVDMIAKTITINFQTRNGETTTPKGRTRRTVPMTSTLYEALKRMSVVREGLVTRNLDGSAKRDGQSDRVLVRICRRAGLPIRYWHVLRHTFGTHAALFGVNPWRLQTWMGHKRIDETMIYVHVAEDHARDVPEHIHKDSLGITDPDRRIVAMLGARGSAVAAGSPAKNKTSGISAA